MSEPLVRALEARRQADLAGTKPVAPGTLEWALGQAQNVNNSYWDRQGLLARQGLEQADQGANQVRGGDLSGLANLMLGPVNYLTSPINALLPTEESTRAVGRSLGGNVGEAVAAGGLGLAAIALPGPDIGKGTKLTNAVDEGITAYHGSPHTFDKFSMDKIGTGEGAQAYGHGLYFAENENVAKSYRGAGSGAGSAAATLDGVPVSEIQNKKGALDWLDSYGSVTNTRAALKGRHPELLKELDDLVDTGRLKEGATYQVRLNVKPDELLDWDKPLSEQPKHVQEALRKEWLAHPDVDAKKTGASIYQATASDWMKNKKVFGNVAEFNGNIQAAKTLKKAGVKGIRYKDAGSRDKDGGTYNYVIFDDSLVSILKRYAIPFTVGAGGAAIVSGQNMPPEIASQLGPQA